MSSGVQLSGNEMLNKEVLSSRRNVRNDETVRRETGSVPCSRHKSSCKYQPIYTVSQKTKSW